MNGDEVLRVILAAIAGAVTSLVAVRTKFALIDARFEAEKKLAATLREHDQQMLDKQFAEMRNDMREHQKAERQRSRGMARRQRVMLELVADMANSMGIKHRALGVDALVRTFNDETKDEGADD